MIKKLVLLLLLVSPVLMAEEAVSFQENENYFEIFPNYPSSEKGKVDVQEFFWYNCPHCYEFEPFLEPWVAKKPEDINFSQVPALFGKSGRLHAELYYALEAMGKLPDLHLKIFKAIHEEGQRLESREVIESFLQGQGVDLLVYRQAVASFGVQTKVNRAEELGTRYMLKSVPTVVVNGTYRTGQVNSYEQKIELIDYLIDKVRQEPTP